MVARLRFHSMVVLVLASLLLLAGISPTAATTKGKQWEGRYANGTRITPADLQQTLADHQEWLASNQTLGNRADFSWADLSSASLAHTDLTGVNFYSANLAEADLSQTNLLDASLSGANLSRTNLHRANLYEVSLYNANLTEADLSRANLSYASLNDAVLTRTNLSRATLFRTILKNAHVSEADLSYANLSEGSFSAADLSRANLSHADLSKAWLDNANLFEADFSHANLSGAVLRNANLAGAWLFNATMDKVEPQEVNLTEARRYPKGETWGNEEIQRELADHKRWLMSKGTLGHRANLYRANLAYAQLANATLNWADLGRANMTEANLVGADLSGARISNADLSRAWLGNAKLVKSRCEHTKLAGAWMHGTNMTKAVLSWADLSRADLSRTDLTRADLFSAILYDAMLANATLVGALLNHVNLANSTMYGANLEEADLWQATMGQANLNWANLTRIKASDANISRAWLQHTNMTNATLSRADLSWADLTDANLDKATLNYAKLAEATLERTHLNGANLWAADLSNATLEDAHLDGAKLWQANMTKAYLNRTDFSEAELYYAILDKAYLVLTKMKNTKLYGSTLNGTFYGPLGVPDNELLGELKGLSNLSCHLGLVSSLMQLRNALREAGLRESEREVTYSIERARTAEAPFWEKWFRIVLFDWPCAYGMYPGRPMWLMWGFLLAFIPVYWLALWQGTVFRGRTDPPAVQAKERPWESFFLSMVVAAAMATVAIFLFTVLDLLLAEQLPPAPLPTVSLLFLVLILTYGLSLWRTRCPGDISGQAALPGQERPDPPRLYRVILLSVPPALASAALFLALVLLGVDTGRPAQLRVLLVFFCAVLPFFWLGLCRRRTRDGIIQAWSGERPGQGPASPVVMRRTFWPALAWAAYFSLLSTFNLGFREINVGTWIARIQPREYALQATGWVRTVAGVQSLISFYLLALWVLTYFGRPFD